jgi:Ca2+-binding EF-hand superfamily protein
MVLAGAAVALALASTGRAASAQGAPAKGAPAPAPAEQDAGSGLSESEQEQLAKNFETADYDSSGWISYREAEQSLLHDREEFARFDSDGDGRIDLNEFAARYAAALEQVGGFQPPIPEVEQAVAPPRGPEELRDAFDTDLNGAIDLTELTTLIADYQIPDLPAGLAMSQLDRSGNGRLELIELEFVSTLLDAIRSTDTAILPSAGATTLEGLFGVPIPMTVRRGQIARPPRIGGPVDPFARLDLDRDGGIDVEDLNDLQFPMALPVRPATVIASLDTDGDGRLDAAEFRRAMGGQELEADH